MYITFWQTLSTFPPSPPLMLNGKSLCNRSQKLAWSSVTTCSRFPLVSTLSRHHFPFLFLSSLHVPLFFCLKGKWFTHPFPHHFVSSVVFWVLLFGVNRLLGTRAQNLKNRKKCSLYLIGG